MRPAADRHARLIARQDAGLRMKTFLADPYICNHLDRLEAEYMRSVMDLNCNEDERRTAVVSARAIQSLRQAMLATAKDGERAEEEYSDRLQTNVQG